MSNLIVTEFCRPGQGGQLQLDVEEEVKPYREKNVGQPNAKGFVFVHREHERWLYFVKGVRGVPFIFYSTRRMVNHYIQMML
jgi:hypothetical protein